MIIIAAFLWLVGLSGAALLLRGVIGRRVGPRDAPYCRRCRFDLSGTVREIDRGRRAAVYGDQPTAQRLCPECGAGLEQSGALRLGLRRRRWWMAGVGGAVAVLVALFYASLQVSLMQRLVRAAPISVLEFALDRGGRVDRAYAAQEIGSRAASGRLHPSDPERIAAAEAKRIRAAGARGERIAIDTTMMLDQFLRPGVLSEPLAKAVRTSLLEIRLRTERRSFAPGEVIEAEVDLETMGRVQGHSLINYYAIATQWSEATMNGSPIETMNMPSRRMGTIAFAAPTTVGKYRFGATVNVSLYSSFPFSSDEKPLATAMLPVQTEITVASPPDMPKGLPERANEFVQSIAITAYVAAQQRKGFLTAFTLRRALPCDGDLVVETLVRQQGRTWAVCYQLWKCESRYPHPSRTISWSSWTFSGPSSRTNFGKVSVGPSKYPTNPTISPGPVDIIIIPANLETRAAMGFGEHDKAEIVLSNVTPLWLESGPQPWPLTFFEPTPAPAAAPPANTIAP